MIRLLWTHLNFENWLSRWTVYIHIQNTLALIVVTVFSGFKVKALMHPTCDPLNAFGNFEARGEIPFQLFRQMATLFPPGLYLCYDEHLSIFQTLYPCLRHSLTPDKAQWDHAQFEDGELTKPPANLIRDFSSECRLFWCFLSHNWHLQPRKWVDRLLLSWQRRWSLATAHVGQLLLWRHIASTGVTTSTPCWYCPPLIFSFHVCGRK